jgi:hypothetical protein
LAHNAKTVELLPEEKQGRQRGGRKLGQSEWENYWTDVCNAMYMRVIDTWATTQFKLRSKANWLLGWAHPDFTTVSNDPRGGIMIGNSTEAMLADALIIASSSPSSEEFPAFLCKNGLSSITLNGTQDDWKNVIRKLDLLENFGKELRVYSRLLRRVLFRSLQTFDKP